MIQTADPGGNTYKVVFRVCPGVVTPSSASRASHAAFAIELLPGEIYLHRVEVMRTAVLPAGREPPPADTLNDIIYAIRACFRKDGCIYSSSHSGISLPVI